MFGKGKKEVYTFPMTAPVAPTPKCRHFDERILREGLNIDVQEGVTMVWIDVEWGCPECGGMRMEELYLNEAFHRHLAPQLTQKIAAKQKEQEK